MRKTSLLKRDNIEGIKFGKLTAIKFNGEYKRGNRVWICKCDCGNYTTTITATLKRGDKVSCGCSRKAGMSNIHARPTGESSKNRLFNNYIQGAKRRNLLFDIDKEYFFELTKKNCHYCGIQPFRSTKGINKNGNGHILYNGIDRKEPNLGYTKDNSVSCCKNCNYAKGTMTYLEFNQYIERLINFNK
jgi:hypothetical protein